MPLAPFVSSPRTTVTPRKAQRAPSRPVRDMRSLRNIADISAAAAGEAAICQFAVPLPEVRIAIV